jgi:hypothetical protein
MSTHTESSILHKINKWFNQIGQLMNENGSIHMKYTINQQEPYEEHYEEPMNTFTSLNFIIKLLTHYKPSEYEKLLNKIQAIRFVRVIEQYILKIRNTNINFMVEHATHKKIATEKNIPEINKIIQKIIKYFTISEEDLLSDTPQYIKTESPVNEDGLTQMQQKQLKHYATLLENELLKKDKENKKYHDRRLYQEDTLYKNKKELNTEIESEIKSLHNDYFIEFYNDFVYWYSQSKYSYPLTKLDEFVKRYNYQLMNIRPQIYMYQGIKKSPTLKLLVKQRKELNQKNNGKKLLTLKERKELNKTKRSNVGQLQRIQEDYPPENIMKYSRGLMYHLQLKEEERRKQRQYQQTQRNKFNPRPFNRQRTFYRKPNMPRVPINIPRVPINISTQQNFLNAVKHMPKSRTFYAKNKPILASTEQVKPNLKPNLKPKPRAMAKGMPPIPMLPTVMPPTVMPRTVMPKPNSSTSTVKNNPSIEKPKRRPLPKVRGKPVVPSI